MIEMFKSILKILSHYISNTSNYNYTTKTLAHACSTPLTILHCNLEQLLIDTHSNQKVIQESLLATERLSALLESNYNQDSQKFNLKQSLDIATAFVKMKYDIQILHCYENLNIEIEANQYEIEETLICLLNNAAESYTSVNGSDVIILYGKKNKRHINLWIQDFGRGMNRVTKHLSSIHTFTTKKNGSGLGLSFARDVIVKKYHGSLECESKLGIGTTISISLPFSMIKRSHILG